MNPRSRAGLMLAVLRDGRKHSRDDIFKASGRFMLTNNASSELRAAGFDVRHKIEHGVHVYWLVTQPVQLSIDEAAA